MANITLTINKAHVYDEVAKTTAYAGAKAQDDGSLYERIFTTDEDRLMLERFWSEACSMATEVFMPFISSVSDHGESRTLDITKNYQVTLSMSSSFDTNLKGSMESSLFSFFVSSITGKWSRFTAPNDVVGHSDDAATAMLDVKSKLYFRKKPTRTNPV